MKNLSPNVCAYCTRFKPDAREASVLYPDSSLTGIRIIINQYFRR